MSTSNPHAPTTASHLPALTGLRGIASGWVLLYHLWQNFGAPRLELFGFDFSFLCAAGYFGVDLFFVLSGFLLGMPLKQALESSAWRPVLTRFYFRRARRVLPAYWTQLLVLFGIAWWMGDEIRNPVLNVASHLSLTSNLFPYQVRPINPVYWSLPVEWDFYLVLPLLAWAVTRIGLERVLGLALAGALMFRIYCLGTVYELPPESWFSWWAGSIHQLPARLDQFLLGMFAASLASRKLLEARSNNALLLASLFILGISAWLIGPRGDVFSKVDAPWVLFQFTWLGLLFAFLCLVASGPGRLTRSALANPPLLFLGTISYSLYLWHLPLIGWLRPILAPHLSTPLELGALLTAILSASTLSWWLCERSFSGR